jgi:hypothetical protein
MRDRGGSHDPRISSELRAKDGTRERITSRGIGAGVAVNADVERAPASNYIDGDGWCSDSNESDEARQSENRHSHSGR